MIDDRSPSDDAPARTVRTRGGRLRPLLIVALLFLLALALATLRSRRREEPTLEPPF